MTAIVLQELTAGAGDDSGVKYWETFQKESEREGTLLVPNGEDWWLAGKILNSLQRGLKSKKDGKIPKMSFDEKQRIIRDVLIARVAKRHEVKVVTDNIGDFKKICRYCNVSVVSGDTYFS